MSRKKAWTVGIAVILFTTLLCYVVARLTNPALWWVGLPLSLLFVYLLDVLYFRGTRTLKELPAERLALNLRLAGVKKRGMLWPFQIRTLLFAGLIGLVVLWGIRKDVILTADTIQELLKVETAWLRIDPPSYSDASPIEERLNRGDISHTVNTGSYLQIRIDNKKPDSNWHLDIRTAEGTPVETSKLPPGTAMASLNISQTGAWAQSLSSLIEELGLSPQEAHTLRFTLRNRGKHEKIHEFQLTVSPVPNPLVEIASTMPPGNPVDVQTMGTLFFRINVTGEVPLSGIDLNVRTKSGYRFSKPLAEFANTNEKTFQTDSAALSTLGIPFSENDILYVKAIARTVVPGLTGESKELSFEVQSRQQARQKLVETLQRALESFESEEAPFSETRQQILQELSTALRQAMEMGRQSAVARNTQQALQSSERMQSLTDSEAREAQKKIRSALESLKRQQQTEQQANLLARMENFRNNIDRANPADLKQLAVEGKQLAEDTRKLKQNLSEAVQSDSFGMTLEEKQAVKKMLEFDHTDEQLDAASEDLDAQNQTAARTRADQALSEANKNLTGAMQILQSARQRAMREARERLTQADEKLDAARSQESREQASQSLNEGRRSLERMPRLGEEFNEAANQARKGANSASQQMEQGNRERAEQSIESAQDAIVDALAALQQEEESDRNAQRDLDGLNYRGAAEAMAAQGQLDMGWRKRILDDIARLKAQGEAADSPIIQYLESRLR